MIHTSHGSLLGFFFIVAPRTMIKLLCAMIIIGIRHGTILLRISKNTHILINQVVYTIGRTLILGAK